MHVCFHNHASPTKRTVKTVCHCLFIIPAQTLPDKCCSLQSTLMVSGLIQFYIQGPFCLAVSCFLEQTWYDIFWGDFLSYLEKQQQCFIVFPVAFCLDSLNSGIWTRSDVAVFFFVNLFIVQYLAQPFLHSAFSPLVNIILSCWQFIHS